MPKKSVRDMKGLELIHYSLAGKVFRATVLGGVIFGLFSLVIGMGVYINALIGQYIGEAYSLSRTTALVVEAVADLEKVSGEVMEIYHGLPEEELAKTGTPEYHAYFENVTKSEGFQEALEVLEAFQENSDVRFLYAGMYDGDRNVLVFIADPDDDPEESYSTGDWEAVSPREVDKFLNWNGERRPFHISRTKDYGWIGTSGIPMKNGEGEVYAFILGDITLENVLPPIIRFLIQFSAAIILVTLVYSFFLLRHMRKKLVVPINQIADAAGAYVQDRQNGVTGNRHFSKLNIHTGDEIENLSLIMGDMEQQMADYIRNLTVVTAEKERIGAELNVATSIQANVLPNSFPAFPERPEFDVYATMTPAKEVGGDFYDFFMIDEDHLALVIADVSDKGIPAALFMMTARTMLKDAALTDPDPARVLFRVNAQLSENNKECMFVTAWFGILEISSGKLTWADAGHEKPMLYQNGSWSFMKKPRGVGLAVFEPELLELDDRPAFVNQVTQLYPGDVLFQYTDGVTEAMTSQREQFGESRLMETVSGVGSVTPEKLLSHVREAVDLFADGAPQFDDLTMLAIQYRGPETSKKQI